MLKKSRKTALLIILGMVTIMSLFGCLGAKKYRVNYVSCDADFLHAKDSYRAGQKVKFWIYLATDTNYSLSVDGQSLYPEVTDRNSKLVYTFVMPEHDVTVDFSQNNSMVNMMNDGGEKASVDYTQTLVADYYTAPIAIVGESIYSEITLNWGSDGRLYLNVYEGSRTEGTTTSHIVYCITNVSPYAVINNLDSVVKKYKMEKWNDQPGVSLDGRISVCKFLNSSNELTRVSTEQMPDNGEEAIAAFREALGQALEYAELIETDE